MAPRAGPSMALVTGKPCICRPLNRRTVPLRCPTPLRFLSSSATSSAQLAPKPAETAERASTAELLTDLRHLLRKYPLLQDSRWEGRLDRASADLQNERRARIAVVGERSTGVSSLVTAAFDDPLASEGDAAVALASRRLNDAPEAIALTYSDKVRATRQELALPISWLRAHQTDFVEIAHGDTSPLESSLDALYASDSIVLLISEILALTPKHTQRLLLELCGKPNLFMVLNSLDPAHVSALEILHHQLESLLRPEDRPKVLVVSTEKAIDGLQALRPDDSSVPVSFEKFQQAYVQSGVPALKDVLARSVATINQPASEDDAASELQLQTSAYMVDKVIGVAASEGAEIEYLLEQAEESLERIRLAGEKEQAQVMSDLGAADGTLKVPQEEVAEARAAFDNVLNKRMAWWKLPGRTDDITTELAIVADDSYLRSFEDKLIFETGRLIGLSSNMSKQTDDILHSGAFSSSARPLASLYSPLLLNRIEQAAFESSKIASTALAAPLVSRRTQITGPGGPSEVLQLRAQKAVVSSATLSSSSIAMGIATHLTEYAEFATSVGVGLFGTALSAWLLQRGWYNAQKKFFVDVEERITGGVEADVANAAQRVVDRSLFKSRTAVAGARQLLRKRQADYRAFASELGRLDRARASK